MRGLSCCCSYCTAKVAYDNSTKTIKCRGSVLAAGITKQCEKEPVIFSTLLLARFSSATHLFVLLWGFGGPILPPRALLPPNALKKPLWFEDSFFGGPVPGPDIKQPNIKWQFWVCISRTSSCCLCQMCFDWARRPRDYSIPLCCSWRYPTERTTSAA